jgi:signal transduction histidine kinase
MLARVSTNFKKIDFLSLRVRLTLGVAIVSALGLGSVAIWMSWKMQQILVTTHKQTIQYIAARFPHDVEIYSEMVPLETGLQKAIDHLTENNTLLWVENPQNKIIAKSVNFNPQLLSLKNVPPSPEVHQINQRYWLLCATELKVKNTDLGKFYIAQNITGEQVMFLSLFRSLGLATIVAIALMVVAIAFYIKQSLQPLQKISKLAQKISVDQLKEYPIDLGNAPSEVQELAQTLEQMLLRLSESWENQRQLLSNVSHELRTPLTIVSGYIQSTLRRGNNLTEIQKEALKIAASEAERTGQLLQDLLDLARADSGRIHLQMERIIVNDLVIEIVAMAKKYSNRIIELESMAKPLAIKVDPHRFKQILLNLIDNAVKYSPPEEPVTVKIKAAEGAIIEVCDRGIGIPLAQQTRIFERFYRVDEARARSSGGTGLGLSIVKTLVEAMEGKIYVRSQPEKGSTFTITFPLA